MGVLGLWEILESVGHPIKVEGLEGKVLGVDANIWLYKFIRGFRERDNATNIESHKLGLFNRISKLLFYRIKPVFVFDGPAPVLKRRTLERRQNIRNKTLSKVQDAAMKAIANQLKSQYPGADIDHLRITLPELRSNNLVAAEKLGDEDFNLFYLPPEAAKKEGEADEETDSDSDYEYSATIQNSNKVDVESKDFKELPPEIRYEILQDIKAKRRRIKNVTLPDDASSFSNLQLERLKARRGIQEKIEECEKEICMNYTGELADGKTIQAFRVQSNASSTILYGNNQQPIYRYPPLKEEVIDTKPKVANGDDMKEDPKSELDLDPKPSTSADIKAATASKPVNITATPFRRSARNARAGKSPLVIDLVTPTRSSPPSAKRASSPSTSSIGSESKQQKIQDDSLFGTHANDTIKLSEDEDSCDALPDKATKKAPAMSPTGAQSQPQTQVSELETTTEISEDSEDECTEVVSEGHEQAELEVPADISSQIKPATQEPVTVDLSDDEASCDIPATTDQLIEKTPLKSPARIPPDAQPDKHDFDTIKFSSDEEEAEAEGQCNILPSEVPKEAPLKSPSPSIDSQPTQVRSQGSKSQQTHQSQPAQQAQQSQPAPQLQQSQTIRNLEERSELIASAQRATNKVTSKIIEDAKELLRLFGIPYMDAAGEAEAQCAKLEELKLTMGTITDDSDIWLFGSQNVYRYFFSNDKFVMQYKMPDIEYHIRMTRENLACFAMLVGSDYTDGIMNVGPVTALEILSEFPGDGMEPLVKFSEWHKSALLDKKLIGDKKRKKLLKYNIPDEFPSRSVYEGYMKPVADSTDEQFTWGTPELDELREYARRNFGWDQKKADEQLLPVMKKLNEKIQKTIDTFFFKTQANRNPEMFRSKRVNQALNKIAKRAAVVPEVVNLSEDEDDDK